MKKVCALLMLGGVLLGLAACGGPAAGPSAAPTPTLAATPAPTPAPVTVVRIIDRAAEEELPTPDVLEGFWRDEEYHYFFGSLRSGYIIVHYSDGTQEPVREALAAGRVTIADLDRFGIGYYKEKRVTVTGMECREGVLTALGLFWSEGEYDYYFPCCDTEVTVHLSDGRSLSLQDALREGVAAVSDLDDYNIQYYRELILRVVDIVDRAEEDGIDTDDALETFWEDERYVYQFPSIRSHLVFVRYNDGTEEPVKLALEAGRVTIADLDRFGIFYWKTVKINLE